MPPPPPKKNKKTKKKKQETSKQGTYKGPRKQRDWGHTGCQKTWIPRDPETQIHSKQRHPGSQGTQRLRYTASRNPETQSPGSQVPRNVNAQDPDKLRDRNPGIGGPGA